jgi:hypothetical protein
MKEWNVSSSQQNKKKKWRRSEGGEDRANPHRVAADLISEEAIARRRNGASIPLQSGSGGLEASSPRRPCAAVLTAHCSAPVPIAGRHNTDSTTSTAFEYEFLRALPEYAM